MVEFERHAERKTQSGEGCFGCCSGDACIEGLTAIQTGCQAILKIDQCKALLLPLFIRRDIQIVLDAARVDQSDRRYKEPQIGQMRGRATALQRLTVPGRDEFKTDGDALGGTRGTTKQGDKQ